MTTETAPATSEKMLNNRDLMRMYWRSTFLLGSFNFERMQAMGFCYTLMPAIRKFYRDDKSAQAAALKRHLEFYNTHPWVSSVVFGVTAAMEEQKSKGEEISEETITSVKVGLMGPLAGVGDPVFWGTARPVLAALGAGLAAQSGSIVGPLLFVVGINLLRVLTRWYGLKFGYERGTEMVTEVGGGQLKKITQMAAIMGLFVMGALVSKWTSIKFPAVVSSVKNDAGITVDTTVQSILDQLLPGLAALGLTFLCMWLLNKKVNALWIILGMFAVGILGRWTGFLGV